jgi:SAM-dependent methyltransferase
MSTVLNPIEFKQAMTGQWNKAASGWNDCSVIIRPWLLSSTQAMLKMAGIGAGMRVLDVAAGAGDQTLDVAALVGNPGSVVATDISPAILEFAKANAKEAGFQNIETVTADGEALPFAAGSFDAAVCRLGLMFLPDPLKGLQEIYRVLKTDARLCTLVFSGIETNPCLRILMSTALEHAGLPPADPYRPGSLVSLGKAGHIVSLFKEAGFRDCVTTRVNAPFPLPSARAYLDFIRSSAAPVMQILARLDTTSQQDALADMEAKLSVFNTGTGWAGPNELLLTTGVK